MKRAYLTLSHAAELLGVSTATVSNAFNRPGQLSVELRESILARCREIGYHGPGASGRLRRFQHSGVIGVMVSNYLAYSFSDPLAHRFLQSLAEVCEKEEFSLLLMPARDGVRVPSGLDAFVDGFIIYGRPQVERARQLLEQDKAVVTVDFTLPGCTSVNIDNYVAARRCAEHALAIRPDRVGIIGLRLGEVGYAREVGDAFQLFPPDTITVQRLRGFEDALIARDVPKEHCRVVHVQDNTLSLGRAAALHLLTARLPPTLLLCMSDELAMGALQAARDLEIEVPRALRITGFDDISAAANCRPSLTTVRQRNEEKGRIAAEALLGLRRERAVTLPTDLVVRESCP